MSGADAIDDRPGFTEMLEQLMSNGSRTILVESPDRFARDLMVQLAGHDMLKARGISVIAASAPTFFIEDTPTAVLVRQVLSAVDDVGTDRDVPRPPTRPSKARSGRTSVRAVSIAKATSVQIFFSCMGSPSASARSTGHLSPCRKGMFLN